MSDENRDELRRLKRDPEAQDLEGAPYEEACGFKTDIRKGQESESSKVMAISRLFQQRKSCRDRLPHTLYINKNMLAFYIFCVVGGCMKQQQQMRNRLIYWW
eukprot:TRINITY_DN17317_c0_g1_i1.p2 TRINITY_DN17317_c0_g1~~TRINITY_DN17317_c0_g1_i1.p2  ORF type:complete len:102 (+),score=3.95 TRINITY_DN17317_c0_g1_i1:411-716(+)